MNIVRRAVTARILTGTVIIGLFAGMQSATALENGIGRTPAMGWNPWNAFLGDVFLPLLKEIIDSMASNGMRDAGYTYVCADGGGGSLMYGPEANIKAFIDYGHSKGFKVGLYCYSAKGREVEQVSKWAGMGFDYLKHDDYNTSWIDPTFIKMRNALKSCGRPVYYTIHPNNFAPVPDTLCNAQRVGNDINWKKDSLYWYPTAANGLGVMGEVMESRKREHLARPGYFNDMDMMGVGMPRFLTTEEARTHFGFWCIMASLLLEGSDVRKIAKDRLEILLNRELIAVNQDSLGEQGRLVWSRYANADSSEVISKRMKDGSRAVMLFNRHGPTKSITVRLSDIGLTGTVHVRDLWKHIDLPDAKDSVTIAGIAHHGCAMLRISNNLISAVYSNPPRTGVHKNAAAHAVTHCLFNTQSTSGIRLLPNQTGLQVFNLQGALLWEMHQPGRDRKSLIRLPAAIDKSGTVVVKFTL